MSLAVSQFVAPVGDTSSGLTLTSNTGTPDAHARLLAHYYVRNADAASDPGSPSTVVGWGITFDLVKTVQVGSRRRIGLYIGSTLTPTSDALVMTWAGNIAGIIGIDTLNGPARVVQSASNTGTSTTITATLAAFEAADDLAYGFAVIDGGPGDITPATGFTEIAETDASVATGMTLSSFYYVGDANPSVTVSVVGGGNAIIGVELAEVRPSVSNALRAINPDYRGQNPDYRGISTEPIGRSVQYDGKGVDYRAR